MDDAPCEVEYNFTKFMKISTDFILFILNGLQSVILAHINAV
jgi:hypothetical protein